VLVGVVADVQDLLLKGTEERLIRIIVRPSLGKFVHCTRRRCIRGYVLWALMESDGTLSKGSDVTLAIDRLAKSHKSS